MPAIFVWKSQTRRSTPSDLATEVGRTKPPHSPTKYCTIKYHLSKWPQTPPWKKRKKAHSPHAMNGAPLCAFLFFYFYFFLKRPRVFNVICVWQNSKRTQCLKAAVFAWLVFSHSLTLAYFIIQGCCCFERDAVGEHLLWFSKIKVLSLHQNASAPQKNCQKYEPKASFFFSKPPVNVFFFLFMLRHVFLYF